MYKCGNCNKVVPARRPMLKLIQTEQVTFPFRMKVNTTWDGRVKDDPGGRGTRIVKETPLCFGCNASREEIDKIFYPDGPHE